MSRPPIPWSAADLLDLARAAKALGALSFQLAERFGPDDGLELSCRATAALLDRVMRDEAEAALRHAIMRRLEAEADHAREMQERSPIGESEESGEEAVPHGGPAPQGKA
ncbi:Hypothetical protein HVPorG_03894 (plasmid) [Roseomonas mucosa]|uniref:hypothetical protein n=1 Tax=Roseomonas mucosa TaxID=207340 RepID=UPI0022003DD5|nr:hypothetical protein [Roseomonas mucosa]QDJ12061.1 Hypothetical protein HVPorG_03894 [Roseomonas mucosa]UZO94641.1 Hypothetical protein RMP42_03894 [Roseomonas mucosa]